MKRFIIPILLVIFVIIEVVLALKGPMAFVQKPSMVVTLPFAFDMPQEDLDAIFENVQEALARTRVFRVIPHSLIDDYYLEKEDNSTFTIDSSMGFADYERMAKELGLERVAVISVYTTDDDISVSITLRNITTDSIGSRFTYDSTDVATFLGGKLEDGSSFDLAGDLRQEVRGVSLFDNLVFLLFAGQVVLAILLALRRRTDLFNQILAMAGILLFLFAFVYAKNASMDYVQRFIANNGAISLAESTLTEQLYTLIRFGPLFALNAILYIASRMRRSRPSDAFVPSAPIDDAPGDGAIVVIRNISARWALPLALVGSVLFSLSFPSFLSMRGFAFLAWIALVPLFLVVIHSRPFAAMVYIVSFGSLTSLILNYWQGTYSYISLAFSVIIISVFFVILAPLLVVAAKGLGRWGFLAMPFLWVAFDFSRAVGYVAYPWGFFGVSQYAFIPLIQVSDLAGVWAVTFILVLWNAALAWTLAYRPRRTWIPLVAAAGLAVLALGYGTVRLIGAGRQDEGQNMRVVLVQQNTDPRKHDYQLSFDTLKEQTMLALADSAPVVPDLVVWPEGGFKSDIRYWLDRPQARSEGRKLVDQFLEFTSTLGTYLATGTQDHVYETDSSGEEVKRNFNSSVFVNDRGEVVEFYHKIHLVPFTEHFPYKEKYPALAALLDKFDTADWKPGEERTVFDHPIGDFFTPICFEDIFPDDIRRFVLGGADLIANISNDYWSLDPVEGKQHAVHSIFRAVENRRPMVRATASGLTTAISPEGRLSKDHPDYYTAGYLIVDIPIRARGMTVYTRWGDWLPWLSVIVSGAALVYVLVSWIVTRTRKKATKEH